LGDESLGTGTYEAVGERYVVGEAEHDDGAVRRVRSEIARAFTHRFCFAIRVEKRHINRSLWFGFDIHLHNTDLRLVGPKEGAKAFEDDLVIVNERDANRFGHAIRILPPLEDRKTRSGDLAARPTGKAISTTIVAQGVAVRYVF